MAATNLSAARRCHRVRRQHETIRGLFDEVEAASPARRAEAFQPLVRLLAVHETAEEMVVYQRCCWPDLTPAPLCRPAKLRRTRRRSIWLSWRGLTPVLASFSPSSCVP